MSSLSIYRSIVALAIGIVTLPLFAKVYVPSSTHAVPDGVMVIDSIDYRTDLTRIYGKLIGIPHTSNRIDEIPGATDIDGVDFKRWYQFEEDGKIPVEIDLPAMPQSSAFQLKIVTTRGLWNISVK